MAILTVEGVPEGLLARLAVAAATHRRSVSSEVILSLVRHLDRRDGGGGEARREARAGSCARYTRPCDDARRRAAPWGEP